MDFNLVFEENPVIWTPPAEGENSEHFFNTLVDADDHVKSKNESDRTEAKFGCTQLPLFLSQKLFLSLSRDNQQILQRGFKIVEYPYVIGEEKILEIIQEMYIHNIGTSCNSPPTCLKMQQCSILRGVERSICKNSMKINIFYNGKNDLTLATVLAKLLQRERCPTCAYPVHNHQYYYTRSGGKVIKIGVKMLDPKSSLPRDDNIWFWSYDSNLSSSTSRTIMSANIGNLSFGRFLEKMFNIYSAKLLLFGFRSTVVMFYCSKANIYQISHPRGCPLYPPIKWFNQQINEVMEGGTDVLFKEIGGYLSSPHLKNLGNPDLNYVIGLLEREKMEFKESLEMVCNPLAKAHFSYQIMGLNLIRYKLLFLLFIRDMRLQCLTSEQEKEKPQGPSSSYGAKLFSDIWRPFSELLHASIEEDGGKIGLIGKYTPVFLSSSKEFFLDKSYIPYEDDYFCYMTSLLASTLALICVAKKTEDGSLTYDLGMRKVTIIYEHEFFKLRKQCHISEEAYLSSISLSNVWKADGGKSKAFFAKTLDDRFILKEINQIELDSFNKMAPFYFKHVTQAKTSSLAKIFGVYQVFALDKEFSIIIMENIFAGKNISKIYDLKGAHYNRFITEPARVLLDENFVQDITGNPYFIGVTEREGLLKNMKKDTKFLKDMNIMDYSLMVGIDDNLQEFNIGIIDYLRPYTFDKIVETVAKLIARCFTLPTILPPEIYETRFKEFLSTYLRGHPAWPLRDVEEEEDRRKDVRGASMF